MDNQNLQPNISIQSLSDLRFPAQAAVSDLSDASDLSVKPQGTAASQVADLNTLSSDKVSFEGAEIQEIEVAKISPNPFQPRKVFQQEALQDLANSIKQFGVIQPLVVSRTETGYELIVGERRFRASQLAGLHTVPAIIKAALVDQSKLEVALIENIQRQELNPIEEAQAYERLMKTFQLTQDQVAKK